MKIKRNTPTSRKSEVSPLKEAIDELLEVYKLKRKLSETHVVASWEKIMGSPIAKRTTRLLFQNHILYVTLSSAPLKQELTMSKQKIVKMINEDLGETFVNDVIFL